MGSRMMHFAIAQQVKPKDLNFIYGSLAPDVSGRNRQFKVLTHFMSPNTDGVTYTIHPEWFANKYRNLLTQDAFVQGYYAHLRADEIWLQTVFNPLIRPQLKLNRESKLKQYYADFHTLNLMIAKRYQLSMPALPTKGNTKTVVNEIRKGDLTGVIQDLRDDFVPLQERSLVMLTMPEIEKYISTCSTEIQADLSQL
ncbi:MAG TPA: hypothetical protein DCW31_01555 [Lactobacillus sp.]|nr:hypothetical protein [Lactobacillus sp.]